MPSIEHVEVKDFAPRVLPGEFPYDDLIAECHGFIEATGRLGDVVLVHPYVLHAVSQNHRGTARFITNPPVALAKPMDFARTDASVVERAVLRALGVDRLAFRPRARRERVVPQRELDHQRMRLEQEARLADAEPPRN